MNKKPDRHSVFREPHLAQTDSREISSNEAVEHTVWDEPALADKRLPSAPIDGLTYDRWLAVNIENRSFLNSWVLTIAIALVAGPFAVIGALLTNSFQGLPIVSAVFVAPPAEEIFKVACLLWIIEKRPFRFTSRMQIAICAIAGGLAFAVIENLLYQLRPEVRENPDIMQWRWTVGVVLHVPCWLISSLGLMRTWNLSMTRNEKPNMATSAVFIMAAAILHGLYNLGCILFELKEKVF
ncbi:MAG: PrsW family intramembrane metalloprotease [Pirellulales bacterium]|nr:PrsW family intramembrane metalloprotease [Pirellulales bacterium]